MIQRSSTRSTRPLPTLSSARLRDAGLSPTRGAASLLLLALLALACSQTPATSGDGGTVMTTDGGVRVDGGRADTDGGGEAIADGGPATCSRDADCDDGNSATIDRCYLLQGVCYHRACNVDSDCNDGDPITTDTCELISGGLDTRCQHTPLPGRCNKDADCDDGVACSTDRCVDRICVHTADMSCAVDCAAYRTCGAQDALGAPCGSLPIAPSDCLASAGACPTLHLCGDTFYVGYAAGTGCSNPCPATPPPAGATCDGSRRIRCDYGLSPAQACNAQFLANAASLINNPPGHPRCECRITSQAPAGEWLCQAQSCPALPPSEGAAFTYPAGAPHSFVQCEYFSTLSCQVVAATGMSGAFVWHCFFPRPCPRPAPADASTCDPGQDDTCNYARESGAQPATQYVGFARCGADQKWHSTASLAADCPAAVPIDARFPTLPVVCTRTTGNQTCVYFEGTSSTESYRCGCGGIWHCTAQRH